MMGRLCSLQGSADELKWKYGAYPSEQQLLAAKVLLPAKSEAITVEDDSTTVRHEFYVKTLTGKTIPMELRPESSIMAMKNAVQITEGIPTNQQRMIFSGKQVLF